VTFDYFSRNNWPFSVVFPSTYDDGSATPFTSASLKSKEVGLAHALQAAASNPNMPAPPSSVPNVTLAGVPSCDLASTADIAAVAGDHSLQYKGQRLGIVIRRSLARSLWCEWQSTGVEVDITTATFFNATKARQFAVMASPPPSANVVPLPPGLGMYQGAQLDANIGAVAYVIDPPAVLTIGISAGTYGRTPNLDPSTFATFVAKAVGRWAK
jgi:hypothetical protein